ncbi:hypothetical protein GCM10017653_13100 [Ancylobacter defluvii]|uniref:Uncharacterized protein n=1 Tax=Ancylobacter defluvii TaxID=1282440 RepID=A0A9W6JV88_9HYPH|nr:hypothetical protein GCM10017653_13100 [Ancylobacter defluvii]
MLGNAGIAGNGDQRGEQRALRQLPGECMLAAARAQQQNFHASSPVRVIRLRVIQLRAIRSALRLDDPAPGSKGPPGQDGIYS